MKNKLHRGEFFRRAMSLAVALVMLLGVLPMMPRAHAAEAGTTLYLVPNANWKIDNARFAAYFFGNGETWVSMTDEDGDGYYEVVAPEGYSTVIFCRMNPNTTENNWDNKWNQTADLTIPTDGTNCYTVAEGAWDKGDGTWSSYAPVVENLLYLVPNSNWKADGARFAAYFFGNGETWVSMTDEDGDGYYEVAAPEGYPTVIFCRMNPNTTENNWDNKWNQTADLTIPTDGTNCYTVAEGAWDKGDGTWSVYPAEDEEEPTDPEIPDEPTATYYVAGDAALCGVNWSENDASNQMTHVGDGIYEKVYTNVAAGTYNLKVTDGTWANSWGNGTQNVIFVVSAACDVTVTFDSNTKTVSVTGDNVGKETGLEISSMHAVGNGSGNWLNGKNWDVTANIMTEVSENVYEITFENVAAGSYEFKFAANAAWIHSWGGGGAEGEAVYNGQNIALSVAETSDVTLKIDLTGYDHSTKNGASYSVTSTAAVEEPTQVDYYLVGYINATDYSGTDYKFQDGKLTATFTSDTYVAIKSSEKESWYMTDGWQGSVSSVTLYDSSELSNPDKLQLPTNTEITLTLTENADGTLTLSYAQVIETPEIPEGYNTVTIHFLKPATWGSAINAYLWNDDGAVSGYEHYNTWPGSPIPENADKDGWYDITVATENPQAFNFIFNDGSNQTADLTTGEVTGPTELWVVDGTVYTEAPRQWTHYTVIIHFQKPENWGGTVNAYAWDDNNQQLMGAWPGTVTSPSANTGWYNTTIYVEIGRTLNFIFNDGSNQTSDLSAGVLTGNTELWIGSDGNEVSKPNTWVDENRTIHLPGTLGGNNWNAAGNQMEYDVARGLYTITFENVTPGTYEYKIAVNGGWAENYGANGEANGGNMSVTVAEAQDITFWYNDSTHRVVCSVSYDIDAVVTLSGTGIADGTKLTDPDLKGLYTVTVELSAGTYSDLKITHGDYEVPFNEFELTSDRNVTFSYDPSTGMAYHNGSDKKVETGSIYYNSRDLDYKEPFGAVVAGEDVTFAISTGTDATAVVLAIRGIGSVKMTKDGEAVDGVQRWVCTTTFENIGEYQYYFAITNGSDMVFYCDDTWNSYYKTGDYGTGTVGNPDDIFAYDLVVYEAGYETPDWMKNAVIYQIFPDRFFDGDESNNFAQTWARGEVDYEFVSDWYLLPENPEMAGEPDYPTYAFKGDGNWSNEIYGGDLKGIVEKIDYLKALGVNVIYLNPVFWSISNHRYDAVSYAEIDPILGTLGDFEELVAVAEANDMHIILDGVFNHVSDDSIYFDRYYKFLPDAAEKYDGKIGAYPYWAYVYDYMNDNGADQATAEAAAKAYFGETYGITDYSYTEWFAVTNVKGSNGIYAYEGWWGYDSMPVIKSTNGSEYQTGNWAEEIIDGENSVNAYWISKGMDGWRLDVANEVSDETWQNFRDSVKALDSEAVIIGEIWADATHYLMGDMYDSVMNYVFRDAVAGFARGYLINRDNKAEKYDKDLTADEAMTILEILRERYPEEAFYAMMNLVASHDTSRILSYLDDLEDDRYQKDMEHAFPTYEKTSDRAKQLQYVVSFLQFTYAGAPTIYYGDEIGMVGGDDPDDRRAFTWGKGNQEIVEWYAELAAIRNAYPVLRTGSVEAFSTGDDDVMGFVRADDVNTVVVLANRANAEKTVAYEGTWVDLVSGKTFTDFITVPAYRGVILVAEEEVKTVTVNTAALAPAYDAAYTVAARADHAHKWNEGEQTVAPGCETDGEMTYTCTVDGCGETKTEAIAPTGHDHEATVTAPTCTEGGYTTYTCECGDSYISDEIPALGHNVVLKEEKAPGCETYGYEYYACERCGGAEYQLMIDPTGHNYEDGTCTGCGQADPDASKPGHGSLIGNLIGKWFDKWFGEKCDHEYESVVTAPTCTDRGYTTHTCIHCGDHYCDSYVAALGHDYEDGVCGSCGQAEPTKPSWGSIWDLIFWWR